MSFQPHPSVFKSDIGELVRLPVERGGVNRVQAGVSRFGLEIRCAMFRNEEHVRLEMNSRDRQESAPLADPVANRRRWLCHFIRRQLGISAAPNGRYKSCRSDGAVRSGRLQAMASLTFRANNVTAIDSTR